MWIKLLFILVLLAVLVNLVMALFHLVRDDGSTRTVRALTWRTLLSIVLFLLLLLAFALGLIRPHAPPFLHNSVTASSYHQ